jgi:protein-L-isoaspartate(D-aspartate) O-methyltransferase
MLLHIALLLVAWAPDQYQGRREVMVREQIEARGVRDADVLRVMRAVPRHEFVTATARDSAYQDRPLSIGYGATISQPYIVAIMTDLLDIQKRHTVLEIGTGSGYQAAILSLLAKQVYSIEIVPELATEASQRLQRLGYETVEVRQGDGYQGWPDQAPFDRIILTAAPPSIPDALVRQLKPGGLMVAPIGPTADQELVVLEKGRDGKIRRRSVIPVMFVPMVPQSKN